MIQIYIYICSIEIISSPSFFASHATLTTTKICSLFTRIIDCAANTYRGEREREREKQNSIGSYIKFTSHRQLHFMLESIKYLPQCEIMYAPHLVVNRKRKKKKSFFEIQFKSSQISSTHRLTRVIIKNEDEVYAYACTKYQPYA